MATATVAALAGTTAPAALAADDCPNAAVRAQQQVQHLPNCLAYERVTPADKNAGLPIVEAIADDSGGVLFGMQAAVGDVVSFSSPQYRSLREADAGSWATNPLLPALDGPVRRPLLADYFTPVAWSRDLSRVLYETTFPLSPNDQNNGSGVNARLRQPDLYLREPDGSFEWLTWDPSVVDTSVTLTTAFAGASPDLERIVMWAVRPWDPQSPGGAAQVYMRTSEGMRTVSVLPDGTLPASGAWDDPDVSADARRVAFSVGTGASERVYVRFNADDPSSASTREVAVGPNGEVCQSPSGGAQNPPRQLQRLSDDGSQVIFRCANALLPGAPAQADYIRDLDGGPAAVRLLGTGVVVGANADFSRIYTEGVAGSPGGQGSISVIRDGVATLVGTVAEVAIIGGQTFRQGAISATAPDGEYLVFESTNKFDLPGVDQGSTGFVGPTSHLNAASQVFLVSARTGELRCVSCQPAGVATNGAGQLDNSSTPPYEFAIVGVREVLEPVTSRGSVLFNTTTPLVPEDVNGVADAYAWDDGRPVLLTGGRNRELSGAEGVSPDGRTFFVKTAEALVPDDVDGGQYDVYAVREGGGRLVSEPAAECEANCQGPAAERPGLPGLGSTDVLGRGNLVEETTETKSASRASASLTVPRAVRGTRTTVRVKVSRAGSIRVSGAGLRQATVRAKKAGTYRVTVRLSSHGAQQQRSRGRLATTLTARLTPTSGASVSVSKSVTFTATKKGGR